MEGMLEMLMVLNGLANPMQGLGAEKQRERMAREWAESVAHTAERANAKMVVKAAGKRLLNKVEEDKTP